MLGREHSLDVLCISIAKRKVNIMPIEMPESSKGDATHVLVKAGLSVIPVVGGPAVELFQYLIQRPLERRRTEWMTQIGEKLSELEKHGLKLKELQKNEEFISAVVQASTAALRTHKQEKLTALRNAVLHIATGQRPEETIQHLLLSVIDEFSEVHLRVLKFARAPKLGGSVSSVGLNHILEDNIPALRGQRTLYDQLWKNLYHRRLISTENLHVMMTGNGLSKTEPRLLAKPY